MPSNSYPKIWQILLDAPPRGWNVIAVSRVDDDWPQIWGVHMIDIPIDEWWHGGRAQSAFVRIPGRHRSRAAAWRAFVDLCETRH